MRSGAMYSNVPTAPHASSSRSRPCGPLKWTISPKSMITGVPFGRITMFAGLMSQWTMPSPCRKASASQIERIAERHRAATTGGGGPSPVGRRGEGRIGMPSPCGVVSSKSAAVAVVVVAATGRVGRTSAGSRIACSVCPSTNSSAHQGCPAVVPWSTSRTIPGWRRRESA